jgi:hypothetical protein
MQKEIKKLIFQLKKSIMLKSKQFSSTDTSLEKYYLLTILCVD